MISVICDNGQLRDIACSLRQHLRPLDCWVGLVWLEKDLKTVSTIYDNNNFKLDSFMFQKENIVIQINIIFSRFQQEVFVVSLPIMRTCLSSSGVLTQRTKKMTAKS